MDFWHIFAIAGLVFVILEMFVPALFFLNLAIAGFLTAVVALIVTLSFNALIGIFVGLSLVTILLLRPLMTKNKQAADQTGMNAKYIGQCAKVISPITQTSGVISIYDERWEARTECDEEIPEGSQVKIIENKSLIMYVEKRND